MTFTTDYLVVGSGLTGATIARLLHDAGCDVVVIDRRSHLGGNVHDSIKHGLRVHTYGPHYFRTSSKVIWEWVQRFSEFRPFEGRVLADVGGGRLVQWPPSHEQLWGMAEQGWKPERIKAVANLEEACLAMMPRAAYELFVKGYSEKQWGVSPCELSPAFAKRFSVRANGETRLSPAATYQGLPVNGYAAWMSSMLEGIPVMLDCDYAQIRDSVQVKRKTIYTGPIDEYFGFSLGRLKYRAQKRVHRVSWETQPCVQVDNPLHSGGPHIRTIDWRHVTEASLLDPAQHTVLTTEAPYTSDNPNDYEYPFPDEANAQLYRRYAALSKCLRPHVIIAGRLGTFQYLDMDQAIAKAMALRGKILANDDAPWTGPQFSAKRAFLTPLAATKPSPQPKSKQPSDTLQPVGDRREPREAAPERAQPPPVSPSKDASRALRVELLDLAVRVGDNRTAGSRLTLSCRLELDAGIAQILDRYIIASGGAGR